MGIKATGFNNARSKLKSIKTLPDDKKMLGKLGEIAITAIEDRTARGVSVKGRRFKKYSQGYAKHRSRKGRGSEVNLSFEGRMLSNMTSKIKGNAAVITLPNDLQDTKARVHHTGEGRMPRREFFSLNKKELKKLIALLGDALKAKLAR